MLNYDLKTLVDNLVRILRPYGDTQQRLLIRAILAELSEELGEYIVNFIAEECKDLRQNII